ncbi:MAG: DUF4386 domain-containing protein [Oceanospirillaceae bacterium]|nr:DUF4386 domain-containing protein [Oceanospirillaceae bacterium]
MKTSEFKAISYLRWIGVLYLLVIILAGFSQGYVRGSLISPGDAAATASNIESNLGLFRIGLLTDLTAFLLDAVISVMLYQVFKPFGKSLAMSMSALRLLAHPAIGSLNLINHFMAYHVLGDGAMVDSFSAEQLESLSLFFTEVHQYGYMIAGGFFGMHLLLLAVMIYKSDVLPKWIAGFLIGSAAGYLLETYGNFGIPGYETSLALIVGVSAAIGEIGLTLFLLIRGGSQVYRTETKSTVS